MDRPHRRMTKPTIQFSEAGVDPKAEHSSALENNTSRITRFHDEISDLLVQMVKDDSARTPQSTENQRFEHLFQDEERLTNEAFKAFKAYHQARVEWWEKTYWTYAKKQADKKSTSEPEEIKFLIQPEEIHLLEKKGSGAFGDVYRGTCLGREVAIKVLRGKPSDKLLEEMKREMSLLSHHSHPNILRFYGACLVPGHYQFITEYASGGDLFSMINSKDVDISFLRKIAIAHQIAAGMEWLHGLPTPLLHLDLKPANVLIMYDMTIRICDFGISRFKEETAQIKTIVKKQAHIGLGTIQYLSPEMVALWAGQIGRDTFKPTEKCDVYAFGIILQELLANKSPWIEAKTDIELFSLIEKLANKEVARPPIPVDTPPSFAHLITQCWDEEIDKRPMFKDMKKDLKKAILEAGGMGEKRIINLITRLKIDEGITSVPWSDFEIAYSQILEHEKDPNLGIGMIAFRHFLGVPLRPSENNPTCMLSLDRFFKFKEWFGPLVPYGDPQKDSSLETLLELSKLPYFWGDFVSDNEAEHSLKRSSRKKTSSHRWLLRVGLKVKGTFLITYLSKTNQLVDHPLFFKQQKFGDLKGRIDRALIELKLDQNSAVANRDPAPLHNNLYIYDSK